ncbi:MAG: aminodeoxychorismate lyase [Nevskiales bacterium]
MPENTERFLVNGQEALDPALLRDRGLHYGDGVFRTLAVYQGQIQDLDGQLEHLRRDADKLAISAPLHLLREDCEQLLATAGADNYALKIILTRGSSERGYASPAQIQANRFLYLSAAPANIQALASQGVRAVRNPYQLAHNETLAGIKHLNRLEQVLAMQAQTQVAAPESILFDVANNLICASQSNLFFVVDERLCTPGLSRCGIAGRTRARVLHMAEQLDINTEEGDYAEQTLRQASEVFICNSLIGIRPVIAFEDQLFPIGETTKQLQALLNLPALS